MDFSLYKDNFAESGFVVVRGFLPPAEFAELQSELDRYIREIVPTLEATDGTTDAFYQDRNRPETLRQLHRMNQDAFFERYCQHPLWRGLAEALLGESAEATDPEWFNKPPATEHATPPHQDNHYFQLTPPQVLTMWLALDAIDEENGCLRYVKGSHRLGRRPHELTSVAGFSQQISDYGPGDSTSEHAVHLEPGDLVVHHGETIHRADPNRSTDRHRRAFAMVFRGASCRVDEAARSEYRAAVQRQRQQQA